MTSDPQKTVFISYRRSTSRGYARAIFDRLHNAGYDVFLDVNTIDSGAFDEIILRQIAARAHFVVLLSPGALERCVNEDDWLRREIEEAMRLSRNVIPMIDEGSDFDKETSYLPHNIRNDFRRYSGIRLFNDYFDTAMDKLTTRFLTDPVAHVKSAQQGAEEYFKSAINRGWKDYDGQIADYSEVIRLDPKDVLAYNNRGVAYSRKGDHEAAVADLTIAITLDPQDASAYFSRGVTHSLKGDLDAALTDYTISIQLRLDFEKAYLSRAATYELKNDYMHAIADYQKILDLHGGWQYILLKQVKQRIAGELKGDWDDDTQYNLLKQVKQRMAELKKKLPN